LSGTGSQYAHDGHIAWGDLFMNFTGQSLDAANNAGDLFGIRFASNNESDAPSLGLYSNVTGKDVVRANGLLLDDLADYNNWIESHGGDPSIGDLSATDPYFNQNRHIQNVIASGTRIGDVNIVDDLSNLGLDFGQFGATGNHTFALSVDRELLPDGDFLAHLGPECDNDVIAIDGELEEVPEPTTALALGAVGLLVGASRKRRQADDAS
ncbi:MAG: PEP-CTERM sorting domain-containing protein, partial [Kamptonema sp. SIO4C4]|nr:PEP-CTERM sorting domain-containing protein [Kamptonema sp. SIO4C4]